MEMMMDPMAAFHIAVSVGDYSPPAEAAKMICGARGQHPYDTAMTPFGHLPRWQAVILEAKLLAMLGPSA